MGTAGAGAGTWHSPAGFSSFSMLLPQALMGVGTVALTYAAFRRWAGYGAGLLAGGLIVTVPAAALIFRFNNPDALLVLLMTAATYCVVRAIEHFGQNSRRALRWLLLAGAALGLAFLTKMLQGLLVLPALGSGYLLAARIGWWKRIWHLLAVAGADRHPVRCRDAGHQRPAAAPGGNRRHRERCADNRHRLGCLRVATGGPDSDAANQGADGAATRTPGAG